MRRPASDVWVALLDELWEMEISPDRGVEWVICDGDLAIEGAVEIAYPGVKSQLCISHGDPVKDGTSSRMPGCFWRRGTLTGRRLKRGAN